MPSRKRSKGKARKAKATAASVLSATDANTGADPNEDSGRQFLSSVSPTMLPPANIGCGHGFVPLCSSSRQDYTAACEGLVQSVMNSGVSFEDGFISVAEKYPDMWNDDVKRGLLKAWRQRAAAQSAS